MSKHAEKPGWRRRYDDANPIVSFRVTREVKEKLDKIRFEQGVSFSDIIIEGAKLREQNRKKELGNINMGTCRKCGRSMIFNLSNENHIKIVKKAINLAGITHEHCGNNNC